MKDWFLASVALWLPGSFVAGQLGYPNLQGLLLNVFGTVAIVLGAILLYRRLRSKKTENTASRDLEYNDDEQRSMERSGKLAKPAKPQKPE